MTRTLVCAALLLAVAGCSPAASVSVSAPPSTAPSPSTSAAVSPARLAGYAKKLDGGTYVFDNATPNVTMRVPADWYLSEAMPRHFGLHPDNVHDSESLRVWYDMRVASGALDCPEEAALGTGHRALDLIQAYESDHRLVVTTPQRITVGGLQGSVISLGVAPGWKQDCPFMKGVPSVALFLDDNVADEPAFWGVSGPERLRLMILDDGHGSNVIVMLDSTNGKTLDDLEATVRPVLDTFRFETGD
ncbi:MAG TPA: hypothetical protein VFN41_05610 [Candidatus Limnocylindrales bacterium]|nr:hypothetical protein [Candidatus Limnocylindrales bacterium]